MQRLLTFENFVPKNVVNRQADRLKLEHQKFQVIVADFSTNLAAVQGLHGSKPAEQLFIDLLQGVTVHADQLAYPHSLFLFQGPDYLFEYNWQDHVFLAHYQRVWEIFKVQLQMSFNDWQRLTARMLAQYFQLTNVDVQATAWAEPRKIDTHFTAPPANPL